MIVYKSNAKEFINVVREGQIDYVIHENFQKQLGHRTSESEINSWRGSLPIMRDVLELADCPEDAHVTIECQIPNTSKRIDFIVSGLDANNSYSAVVVELKGWERAGKTNKDAIVTTPLGNGIREVTHPSYQAWSYVDLLNNFNSSIEDYRIRLNACAFIHNSTKPSELEDDFYKEYLTKAPLFFKGENRKLSEFIAKHIKYGDSSNVVELIENGIIRPTKTLADTVVKLLDGNNEFVLIDDQKIVFEYALSILNKYESTGEKQVFIVEGGPGTGKSVVAINLLAKLTGEQRLVKYISKNAAPREVYSQKLKGYKRKSTIDNLFGGSGSYLEDRVEPNQYDMLIIDEAHRLNEKSGFYGNEGENQIMELIRASKTSVFFIDEDQRVAFNDIGRVSEIENWANQLGAHLHKDSLESQFRCAGSDGYLSWLDSILGIKQTANYNFEGANYDFKVYDDVNEMFDKIRSKNVEGFPAKGRVVAGYCWRWKSRKDKNEMDVVISSQNFGKQWNLEDHGSGWIINSESMEQIGCIHTCQGLEIAYVGVIIGSDLVVRNGEVLTYPEKRDRHDKTMKGFKKMLKEDRVGAIEKADKIIKNTYRTLMTRGMKGCYIFSEDEETREWFKRGQRMTL